MAFNLTSSAFAPNTNIPTEYTCHGANISPPLSWSEAPTLTRAYALVMDDPDAPRGTWDHWLLYNIPATMHQLPTEVNTAAIGLTEGKNSWQKLPYGGPCPPQGTHRYIFTLYALKQNLQLPSGLTKQQLLEQIRPYIIETATLIGLYR